MKFILSLISTLLLVATGYSQFDNGNNSFEISPIRKNPVSKTKSTPSKFNVFPSIKPNFNDVPLKKEPEIIFKKIGGSKPIDLSLKNDFIKPGLVYQDKLNRVGDAEVSQAFRKNQNLGDFKTKAIFLKILCRDNQFVDGDRVRIYINDLIIQENVLLDYNFQEFEMTLKTGFNKIDIEALNQGTSGPNTAEFQVYDDKGKQISANQWNLSSGFKATIIVIKD
ncbi:MAG: hypothetical protein EXR18_02350 [Flavobacteriaceae bacterium]|nr:hypothetical protein [Flavobacteriaceae bacterium]